MDPLKIVVIVILLIVVALFSHYYWVVLEKVIGKIVNWVISLYYKNTKKPER